MWSDIAMALSCAGCGVSCGWVMHALMGLNPVDAAGDPDRLFGNRSENADAAEETEVLNRVAGTLKEHATEITSSVDAHQNKVESIADSINDADFRTPEAFMGVVEQILDANREMRQKLEIAQDQIYNQTLELDAARRRAETDALTRIPNRGAFDKHIGQQHAVGPEISADQPHAGSLVLLDVDHFKKFNDTYGHLAGDEVLRVVAGVLHKCLNDRGLVARYGGEEFAIILDGLGAAEAGDIVEEVRASISLRKIAFEGRMLSVTASIGVAQLMPGETIEQWIERADSALYKSKEAGRNCGHWMDGKDPVKIESGLAKARKTAKADKAAKVKAETHSKQEGQDESDGLQANEITRGALAYLPDTVAIEQIFSEMRERAGDEVDLTLMSLRVHDEALAEEMESVLAMIRSNLRSVDRMGCFNDETLLICLPSMNSEAAARQGAKIISAVAQLADGDQTKLSLGVAQAEQNEAFETLLESVLHQVR